ncbi:CpsD/CapB family tyrosine-protein kinase [Planococcus sp. YIM B11945]|uniref:CpsD/CapB family tyrosine-protein kinase n=1 Tax=Planococcus sp. YIM B11945 TaxID=3435410 RepID=UPI003D7E1304
MDKKKSGSLKSTNNLVVQHTPKSFISEQYRILRTNLQLSIPDSTIRTIVFTSASHSEGKSTTIANLATVLAMEGKRILLIDADMRNPQLHSIFHIENFRGLSNVLALQVPIKTAIQATEIDNLDLLPGGSNPLNPSELLGTEATASLLEHVKSLYDLVLIDAPSVLAVADSKVLISKCDGTILVVDSGKTDKDLALMAKEAILLSNPNLIGAVINNFKLSKERGSLMYQGAKEKR